MHNRQPRARSLFLATRFALLGCFFLARGAPAQDTVKVVEAKKTSADEMRALIAQLGNPSFSEREAADKRLASIGEPAWELLEAAILGAKDPEVRYRAGLLMQRIGKGMFSQTRRFEGHQGGNNPFVTRVVVTRDGRRAVSVGSDALRSWDLATGKQLATFDERKGAYCWGLALSADGTRVIAGCHGQQAHVFDVATGKKVRSLLGHTAPVWGVALSPDGKQALTGGGDTTVRVWDVDSGQQLRAFQGGVEEVRCLDRFGTRVVTGHFSGNDQPGTVRLWDFESGKEIRAMHGHKESVTSVAFSPDGKTLVSASWDTTVRLWDVAGGKELWCLEGHSNRVEYAGFTPDGKRVVSCGNAANPSLRLWDVATGRQLFETDTVKGGFFCVAALPDGRHCVSAGGDGVIRLWQWKR
jgi:WD40 repeat protein